jgi:hypothetical protein
MASGRALAGAAAGGEHEMGELFKVIASTAAPFGTRWVPPGRPDAPRLVKRQGKLGRMIRWIIVVFLALMLISWFTPLLQKLGFGKLPGTCASSCSGAKFFVPLTTTLLLSLACALLARLL